MDLKIDPDAINRYVAEQILQSTLGPQVKALIDANVKSLTAGYNNPFEPAIKRFIAEEMEKVIKAEYGEVLRAQVKAKIDAKSVELIDKIIDRAFRNIEREVY